ncbi:hypothetical protein [Streptomyces sp. NPDC020747]|uniref:hypothetical protein n=1 Tax=Streptomyces sp. NPDC020747 TaxID=3365086 RepID=UPI00378D501C
MLVSFLPGLREIRTPLATGILWITAIWIVAGEHFPEEQETSGAVRRIYVLVDQLGKPTLTTVGIFGAYLVGSIVTISVRHPPLFSIASVKVRPEMRFATGVAYSQLMRRVDSMMINQMIRQTVRPEPPDRSLKAQFDRSADDVCDELEGELAQLATRLHVVHDGLFDEYDRLIAEGDLRLNVGIAIGGLIAAMAIVQDPWFLLGLTVASALMRRGRMRGRQANDILIQALLSGLIESTTLNDLKACEVEAEEKLEKRSKSNPDGSSDSR